MYRVPAPRHAARLAEFVAQPRSVPRHPGPAKVNHELGVTVILTTHDLSDVERLCSRLMVIDVGRLVYDGTVDNLKARHGQYRTLVVDLESPNGPPLVVDGAEVVRVEGPRQWLRFHRDRTAAAELIAGIARSTPVVDLTVEEPLIEDVISELYAGAERGNRAGTTDV